LVYSVAANATKSPDRVLVDRRHQHYVGSRHSLNCGLHSKNVAQCTIRLFVKELFDEQSASKLGEKRRQPASIPASPNIEKRTVCHAGSAPKNAGVRTRIPDQRPCAVQRMAGLAPSQSRAATKASSLRPRWLVRRIKQETPSTRANRQRNILFLIQSAQMANRTDKETHKSLSVSEQSRTAHYSADWYKNVFVGQFR
jgi:hypothetical protein